MKIQLWSIGKDHEPYIKAGTEDFTKRVSRYYSVEWRLIAPPRQAAALAAPELKKKEGEIVIGLLAKEDWLVTLHERGRQLTSDGLAQMIQQRANDSVKNLVFLIGGIYGLDESVLRRSNLDWCLSMLTFPHQLVRLI